MKLDQTQEYLLLPKGIALNRTERHEMCRIISSGIKEIYKQKEFSREKLDFNGREIDMQYISKAVNNRTLLRKIISDPRKEIMENINNKETLFDFVKNNIYELFHPDGKYFVPVYQLLVNTSQKGDVAENEAFKFIEEAGRKKGLEIKVLKPRKVEDDVYGGIDGFFIYNDREFTIQIKPLAENVKPNVETYRANSDYIIAYCNGFLKNVTTDYLILVDSLTGQKYLYQTKGILAKGSYYLIPRVNFVAD